MLSDALHCEACEDAGCPECCPTEPRELEDIEPLPLEAYVSPYLLRKCRTEAQAIEDLAESGQSGPVGCGI